MGAIDTNYTFTATDVITSTKMNNILDQSAITLDAVFNSTLSVASGKLLVSAGGITSNELGSGSVTSNAIVDGTIVNADINASAAIAGSKLESLSITPTQLASNAVTTTKILNANVTPAKLEQPLTLMTSVSSSGSSFDVSIAPTWVKKITLIFNKFKLSGSDDILVQLGAASTPSIDGYTSGSGSISNSTSGFIVRCGSSARVINGLMQIVTYGEDYWVSSHSINAGTDADFAGAGVSPVLLGPIGIIRIKSTGTNTFTSGAVSVMYE